MEPLALAGTAVLGVVVGVASAKLASGWRRSPSRRLPSHEELLALVAAVLGAEQAQLLLIADEDDKRDFDEDVVETIRQAIANVTGERLSTIMVDALFGDHAMSLDDVVALLNEGGRSLRFSRRLLSTIFENLTAGIVVFDDDLRLVAWNHRFKEFIGLPDAVLRVGAHVGELVRRLAERGEFGPGDVDQIVEARLYHMRHGLRYGFERERPDGIVFRADGGAMPDGGYVTTYIDITAEVRAQEALRQTLEGLEQRVEERTSELRILNQRLAEANRDKTRFLAAASHDLLQPLHAARLFATQIGRDAPEATLPLVDRVQTAINTAESLLRALLDLSQLDAGGVRVRPELIDLGSFLTELTDSFAPEAAGKGLSIRLGPSFGRVVADPRLLRSVLQNFLSNAMRYTVTGGVAVGVRRRAGLLRIDVIDSGVGLHPDDVDRIFEEFVRLGDIETEGFGLGLALSKRLIVLLGGTLEVRSRSGRGSRFSVLLPEEVFDAGSKFWLQA